MTETLARKSGQCRCGQTTFEVTAPPMMTMACHCTGCQRMTGSAFSLSELYPSAAFSVLSGEPVIGGLRGATRHYFCPLCMSWLFTRPEGLDDLVNVRATMFDDARSFVPFVETYTCEKLSWAETSAAHSFERFPAAEDYPRLLAEFAEQNDRGV
jgi:hypothetical protein